MADATAEPTRADETVANPTAGNDGPGESENTEHDKSNDAPPPPAAPPPPVLPALPALLAPPALPTNQDVNFLTLPERVIIDVDEEGSEYNEDGGEDGNEDNGEDNTGQSSKSKGKQAVKSRYEDGSEHLRVTFNSASVTGVNGLRPRNDALTLANTITDVKLRTEVRAVIEEAYTKYAEDKAHTFGSHPIVRSTKAAVQEAVIAKDKDLPWSQYLPSHAQVLAIYMLEPNGHSPPLIDGHLRYLGRIDLTLQEASDSTGAPSTAMLAMTMEALLSHLQADKKDNETRLEAIENALAQVDATLGDRIDNTAALIDDLEQDTDRSIQRLTTEVATHKKQLATLQANLDKLKATQATAAATTSTLTATSDAPPAMGTRGKAKTTPTKENIAPTPSRSTGKSRKRTAPADTPTPTPKRVRSASPASTTTPKSTAYADLLKKLRGKK